MPPFSFLHSAVFQVIHMKFLRWQRYPQESALQNSASRPTIYRMGLWINLQVLEQAPSAWDAAYAQAL